MNSCQWSPSGRPIARTLKPQLVPSCSHPPLTWCQAVGVTCVRLAPPSVKWGLTAPEVAVMSARRDRRGGLQGLPLPGKGSRGDVQRLRHALPFVSFLGLDCRFMCLTKGRKFSATVYSDAFFCPSLPPFASATLVIHILDLSIPPTGPRTLPHCLSFSSSCWVISVDLPSSLLLLTHPYVIPILLTPSNKF